ncbi:hypothetical protein CP966_11355 [Streptomyces galilaeus]|nr:hypothetical protein CP966_11355 [Streptomyces galilaeus]
MDQAGRDRRFVPADPSGVWCVQLQGGGGSRRDGGPPARAKSRVGESATDDNAADVRTRPRDAGMIQTPGPRTIGGLASRRVGVRGEGTSTSP